MPYDRSELRLERFHAELGYHAAFNYWNLRGILAEKWGHGPIFGARGTGQEMVALTPAADEEDRRLQAIYGLNGSGLLAEGETRVPQAREIVRDWFQDSYDVLKPKRVVRGHTQIFALYPTDNAVQLSRRLRSRFYRHDHLESTLPERLTEYRDSYHAAIDWLVPDAEPTTSLIAGAVGPPHRTAGYFAWEDEERQQRWFLGLNFTLGTFDELGLDEPVDTLISYVEMAFDEMEHVASNVLRPLLDQ